jgi:hypothetical protein
MPIPPKTELNELIVFLHELGWGFEKIARVLNHKDKRNVVKKYKRFAEETRPKLLEAINQYLKKDGK